MDKDLNPLNLDFLLQTEGTVLGNILLRGREAMEEALSCLTAEDFTNKGFADIFRVMQLDFENGGDLSIQSIGVGYRHLFNKPIKYSRLTSLLSVDGRVGASIKGCAQAMKEYRKDKILQELGEQIITSKGADAGTIAKMIDERMDAFTSINREETMLKQAREYVDPMIETLAKRAEVKDGITGIASGFETIDKITAGWQPSTMVVIAARPAMGKTAFALSMIRNLCEAKRPVAFFSLEMSIEQIIFRLMSAVAGVEHSKLQTGAGITQSDWAKLRDARDKVLEYPLYIDDTPLSLYGLRLKAKQAKKEKKIEAIVIDYLQLMTTESRRGGSRQEEVANLSRGLKLLAKDLGIPIIVLAQLNRDVEKRSGANKKPQLADLRESGAIEQDADIVAFLHRPEYYNIATLEDGSPSTDKGLFIIAKHRAGRCDDVILNWFPEFVQFTDAGASSTSSFPTAPF